MTTILWLSLGVSALGLLLGVWAHGYRVGINDTERRWSNAVRRAGHQ